MQEQPSLKELLEDRRHPRRAFCSTLRFLLVLLAIFSVVTILFTQIFVGVIVDGSSMEPTLTSGDYLFVDTTADIARGDIVVFASPEPGSEDLELIKRVIGLPGDELRITRDGRVARKNRGEDSFVWLEEDYILGPYDNHRDQSVTVAAGELFVMGDNRGDSHDSRSFGGVPLENVLGTVTGWSLRGKDLLTAVLGVLRFERRILQRRIRSVPFSAPCDAKDKFLEEI